MVDVFLEQPILNPSYYYIKHFSKHIIKGSKRIMSASHSVMHNVFLRPDGTFVIVLMNDQEQDYHVYSTHSLLKFDTILPSHSIQTIIIK